MNHQEKILLTQLVQGFAGKKVLVIGDVMVDEYLHGKVERISPEAPVPIVALSDRTSKPGGAANVALNVLGLGAEVKLIGLRGNDPASEMLLDAFASAGLDAEGLVVSDSRRTTRKARVMAQNQQLLRVDTEDVYPATDQEKAQLWERISKELSSNWPDVVLFEDYDKGVLTADLIKKVVGACREKNIFTLVDPKHTNFWFYEGVSLFKPNLKETSDALGKNISGYSLEELSAAAEQIRLQLGNSISLITLGANGVFIAGDDSLPAIYPTQRRNIVDVCGAGDSVAAVTALSLASKASVHQLGILANIGGGLACEYVGVKPLEIRQLLQAIDEIKTQ